MTVQTIRLADLRAILRVRAKSGNTHVAARFDPKRGHSTLRFFGITWHERTRANRCKL